MERKPKIAILRWEEGHVPEGLMQLEAMPGNSTNPESYPYEIQMVHVEGACVETVITNPSQELVQRMIQISKDMIEHEGIEAICTSCGFNAIFQKQMADALDVPVFSSSLLQVPFVQNIVGWKNTVGVITANGGSLTKEHLHACGITDDMNVVVMGLEKCKEWNTIFEKPDEKFNLDIVTEEIIATAKAGVEFHPEIKAIVLECTDLPPFAETLRKELGMPVFDFNSMMGHVAMALGVLKQY